jgi:hypothetical protein
MLYQSSLGSGYLRLWAPADVMGSLVQLISIPVWWICIALFLFGMTGVASYFFHPKSLSIVRQNRALALSYYACGPLAYMPLTIAVLVLGSWAGGTAVQNRMPTPFSALLFLIAAVPIVAQLVAVITSTVSLLVAITHEGVFKRVLVAGFTIVSWVVLAFLLLVVVPVAWAVLAITLLSFRR